MQTITIAFDVDGTLRCNAEERHRTEVEANDRIRTLFLLLATFKNVELHIWSNRGADYCREIAKLLGLHPYVRQKNYHLKGWYAQQQKDIIDNGVKPFVPDIAIDDQQRFDGGMLNLIVREK